MSTSKPVAQSMVAVASLVLLADFNNQLALSMPQATAHWCKSLNLWGCSKPLAHSMVAVAIGACSTPWLLYTLVALHSGCSLYQWAATSPLEVFLLKISTIKGLLQILNFNTLLLAFKTSSLDQTQLKGNQLFFLILSLGLGNLVSK